MPQKLQGAVMVGYLIGYDPTTTQKDPEIVVTSIIVLLTLLRFSGVFSDPAGL